MQTLDNPIWQALTTTHASFSETCKSARKFPHEVSVLAAFSEPTPDNYHSLASLLSPGERVGLFLQAPADPPAGLTVVDTGPLLQMIYQNRIGTSVGAQSDKYDLIQLTQFGCA
jgi:hypothetical protein